MKSYVVTSLQSNSDLDYLVKQAASYQSNRLKSNYFKLQDFIAVSIIYNPEPIGFSLLQERDIFNGMGRCLTRLYFPAITSNSLLNNNYKLSQGLRTEIFDMLDQQIAVGKKLGINDFFISREDKKPLIMKNIHRGMIRNGYDWKIDLHNKYRVINNHYQWISWTGENRLQKDDVASLDN